MNANIFSITPSLAAPSTGPLHTVRLDHFLSKLKHLPPTPTLMVKLIGLFQGGEHDADDIMALIRSDPALVAQLLRCCNNTFFGDVPHVIDIHEAVFRLGFYEIYRITMKLFGDRALTTRHAPPNFPGELLRKHSVITAMAAGAIARQIGISEGLAFTAGVLHDIGKVVLAVADGPQYMSLLEEHGCHGTSLCQAEQAVFQFDHCQLGSRLLDKWEVPRQISIPVREHHSLDWSGPDGKMAATLHLADIIAHHILAETSVDWAEVPEANPPMEFLELNPEQVALVETLVAVAYKQLPPLTTA